MFPIICFVKFDLMKVLGGGNKIAIVGGGIAGITAAYFLSKKNQVSLFEKNSYLGGHTNTITIDKGADYGLGVDTGFIVLNDKTYPLFHSFLKKLNVDVRYSDMSFAYHSQLKDICYAGTNLNGLFAQRANLFKPRFWSFLLEIRKFCKYATRYLQGENCSQVSVKEFCDRFSLSDDFVYDYLYPMAGAIWSSPDKDIEDFPVETLINFFNNHGLLALKDRPRWQTVVGGSYKYVEAFKKQFSGEIFLNTSVDSIERKEDSVKILVQGQELCFDYLIMAVHADQVLALLNQPTQKENEIFTKWGYNKNYTVLHTDDSFLPAEKRAWASWNFSRERESKNKVTVTYYMNKLQGFKSDRHYCVTLNPGREVKKDSVIKEISYSHPVFSFESVKTQSELSNLNNQKRTFYCGSYHGYGFHEDAVRSANLVVKEFGESL